MDSRFKKLITIIVMIFLFIIALKIALKIFSVVLGLVFPIVVIGGITYIIFRLINKSGARKY